MTLPSLSLSIMNKETSDEELTAFATTDILPCTSTMDR